MVFTRFLTKQKRYRALKRSLGQDIAIETGRGCISGTLIAVRSLALRGGDTQNGNSKLVLRLKDVRIEGDDDSKAARPRKRRNS